jgi:hypothetical protein
VITNYTNETFQAMLELGNEFDGDFGIWVISILSDLCVIVSKSRGKDILPVLNPVFLTVV